MTAELFARFPRLTAPSRSEPVIAAADQAAFPEFQADFELLEAEVAPSFAKYDLAALRQQNRYRRQQVLILLGSALVTGLGGLQAVFPQQRWPSLVVTALGAGLALFGQWAKGQRSLQAFLKARVQAERLRALYFRFLSHTGPYAGPEPGAALTAAVQAISEGREST